MTAVFVLCWVLCMVADVATITGREKLLENFFNDNTQTFKAAQNDTVVAHAIAESINVPKSLQLADAANDNLVLMDAAVSCDSGWKLSSVTNMCYKTSSTKMTWYASEDWCFNQRSGSHLTSVHSKAESEWIAATFVGTLLWSPYMDNWIGLRRACDNVTLVWTDGTPVDFQLWQSGYPRSQEAEKSCATIWVTSLLYLKSDYKPGQWDDVWDCGTNTATPTCKYDPTYTGPHVKYDTTYNCILTTSTSTTSTTTKTTTTAPTTTTTTPTTTTTTPTTTTTTPTTTTTTPTTTTTTPTTTTTTPTTTTTTPTTTTTTPTTTTTTPTTTTTTPTTTTTTPTTTTTTPTTTTTTPTTTTTTPTTTTTTPTTTTTTPTTTTTTPTTTTTTPTTTTTTPTTTTTTPTTTTTTPTTTTTTPTTTTTHTTTKPTTTTPFDPAQCPPRCPTDWVFYNNLCYSLIHGNAGYAEFNAECVRLGGSVAYMTTAAINEAMRLSFSANTQGEVVEAWLASNGYSNFPPGQSGVVNTCSAMILSPIDSSGSYVPRGYWRSYACTTPKQYAFCQKVPA